MQIEREGKKNAAALRRVRQKDDFFNSWEGSLQNEGPLSEQEIRGLLEVDYFSGKEHIQPQGSPDGLL